MFLHFVSQSIKGQNNDNCLSQEPGLILALFSMIMGLFVYLFNDWQNQSLYKYCFIKQLISK